MPDAEEVAFYAWMEGYRRGRHVGHISDMTLRTAARQFDEWWGINYGN